MTRDRLLQRYSLWGLPKFVIQHRPDRVCAELVGRAQNETLLCSNRRLGRTYCTRDGCVKIRICIFGVQILDAKRKRIRKCVLETTAQNAPYKGRAAAEPRIGLDCITWVS